ncbi:hypothetical protein Pcinc_006086 [Petrolisthes cinctipes]|uniref:Uncharacterized protein n=1 Tax=Petrolisthes cinctipes TaxID=88211 RepID=A0AAE1GBB4_PETCI|nr:hypothetical protein Pcinc_006086 [Petrolisthes cinctipes]
MDSKSIHSLRGEGSRLGESVLFSSPRSTLAKTQDLPSSRAGRGGSLIKDTGSSQLANVAQLHRHTRESTSVAIGEDDKGSSAVQEGGQGEPSKYREKSGFCPLFPAPPPPPGGPITRSLVLDPEIPYHSV